jgi:hypothetical protein
MLCVHSGLRFGAVQSFELSPPHQAPTTQQEAPRALIQQREKRRESREPESL